MGVPIGSSDLRRNGSVARSVALGALIIGDRFRSPALESAVGPFGTLGIPVPR